MSYEPMSLNERVGCGVFVVLAPSALLSVGCFFVYLFIEFAYAVGLEECGIEDGSYPWAPWQVRLCAASNVTMVTAYVVGLMFVACRWLQRKIAGADA